MKDPTNTIYKKTLTFHEPSKYVSSNAVVFIHGGAWIDTTNTPHDFDPLSTFMLNTSKNQLDYALYGITYRLSPEVRHPTHLHDVIENLFRLITEKEIKNICLVGHSVGATLSWQVATCCPRTYPFPEKLKFVQSRITSLFLLDGIYSISELLKEYPDYIYFVKKAFEEDGKEFEEFDISVKRLPKLLSDIHLVHSYNDELLSLNQTRCMSSVLQKNAISFFSYYSDMGLHNDVYQSPKLAIYLLNNIKFK